MKTKIIKKITLISILILPVLIFSGCKNENENLLGTYYKTSQETYVFYDNGKVNALGKDKEYKLLSKNRYVIDEGGNEEYLKVSKDKLGITVYTANGKFELSKKQPDVKREEKEATKLLKKIQGKYKNNEGQVKKEVTIDDNVFTQISKSGAQEVKEIFVIEVTGKNRLKLNSVSVVKGEYEVSLNDGKLIFKNQDEKIVYVKEK